MLNIKPILVLTIITAVTAALLIVANIQLKPDDNVLSEQMLEKCVSLMGEGEYEIIPDWEEAGFAIEKPKKVKMLIKKNDGTLAFQISADGYAKDGLNLLIAMNMNGSVKGVSIISMGETPGLGTKVDDKTFLNKFNGAASSVEIVKKKPKNDNEIQALTGATYSSKGVARGINLAVSTFEEMGAGKK